MVKDRIRFKDRYWVKTAKWHLYKRRSATPVWRCRYQFDKDVRALRRGDVAIDLSANIGKFTRLLARTGATVHAFEPDPYSFERLERNTGDLDNVICHNQAVGIEPGTVKLFRKVGFEDDPEFASRSSSVFEEKLNVSTDNYVEVEQIDFIAFLDDLPEPAKLIKVDIEGAEVPLLEKMIETGVLASVGPMFVETHETRIPALAERTGNLKSVAARDFPDTLYLDWI